MTSKNTLTSIIGAATISLSTPTYANAIENNAEYNNIESEENTLSSVINVLDLKDKEQYTDCDTTKLDKIDFLFNKDNSTMQLYKNGELVVEQYQKTKENAHLQFIYACDGQPLAYINEKGLKYIEPDTAEYVDARNFLDMVNYIINDQELNKIGIKFEKNTKRITRNLDRINVMIGKPNKMYKGK